jgi:DnaK suppressor protein
MGGGTMHGGMEREELTSQQIDYFKELLVKKKESLLFNSKYSDEYNLQLEDRSDEVDHANADVLNAERLRFRNRENFFEKKIDEALNRITMDEYGLCRDCGSSIGFLRLNARPTADLCIICKEEAERRELSRVSHKKSKSTGRQISL